MANGFDFANPFIQFLVEDPQLAYYGQASPLAGTRTTAGATIPGLATPFGSSPAARKRFQSQFQNIYNEFLGQQGRALMGGNGGTPQWPQQTFTQFLNEYPFTERYTALPPAMRGATQSTFSPRASYNYL